MSEPTVVLLHGLLRTRWSMEGLRRHLEREGFSTWARTYPSRRLPLGELAEWIATRLRDDLGDREIQVVTHSLGGVVLRYLARIFAVRRAVLLAPPNQGSSLARALADNAAFRLIYGPAGRAVTSPSDWPDPPRPFAVVAGTRAASPGAPIGIGARLLGLLPAGVASDGVVTVEETRHPLMSAHAEVDASHTWIMRHPRARELTVRFLREERL
jgi:pimeloyl-ACP methyl ester carboxylesterase